jgi:integrase
MDVVSDSIKKITLANGKTRYRFVVDIGSDPKTGKRKQLTVTKDTKKEAVRELAKIRHQTATGEYIAVDKTTVGEWLDVWYAQATKEVEEATKVTYRNGTRIAREYLGHIRLQMLSEEDVDNMVTYMVTSGRKRGGKPGSGLGLRSVEVARYCLRAALGLAVRRRVVVRNVAEYTKIPKAVRDAAKMAQAERVSKVWGAPEIRMFLAHVSTDRLHAVLLLSLLGLRPEEVCGLRWTDADLSGKGSLSIVNARTMVEHRVIEKPTKSDAGTRALPLPAVALSALKALKAVQAREKLALGEAYSSSGYVAVDEAGKPLTVETLRRHTYKMMDAAGVRRVRLYDARHACLGWMANNGVPDTVVSAWAGHADLGFTKRHYVHSDPESLRVAADRLDDGLLGQAEA